MKKIDRLLKDFGKTIEENYIDIDKIEKKIKSLENERFKLMNKRLDDLYGDYSKRYQLQIINIQLDILYQILEEK